MYCPHRWLIGLSAGLLFAVTAVPALADPLAGEVLKFGQKVMDGTGSGVDINGVPIQWRYFGHDEESSAYQYNAAQQFYQTQPGGQFMADDFQDTLTAPIVHVSWWGSYLNNSNLGVVPAVLPNKFLIAFESDVPVGPGNPFSHPGTVLQSQIVNLGALSPASGTYDEKLWAVGPVGSDTIYKYNAELSAPFLQNANQVYWLKIVALFDQPPLVPSPVVWGWHNRDYTFPATGFPTLTPAQEFDGTIIDNSTLSQANIYHYLDDAVNGQMTFDATQNLISQTNYLPQNYVVPDDGPPATPGFTLGIDTHSKDLAFELYTIPEPSSIILLGVGVVGLIGYRRRRRKAA